MAKFVLVIDPVATNRIRLSALLEAAQYDVGCAADISDLRNLQREPDLVLLGLSERPGRDIARLTTLALSENTPLLCLDSRPSPLRRLLAFRAGAREVLPHNTTDTFLRARIRGLIRDGDAQRECERRRVTAASFGFADAGSDFETYARVKCVGEHARIPGIVQLEASATSIKLETCGVDEALQDENSGRLPEAYIIASGGSYHALDALLPELRDRDHAHQTAMLVLFPGDRPDIATRALALGASDVAADDATGEELALRIEDILARKRSRDALRRADEQSYRLAATDPLTGLYNRRYAETYLSDLMMRHDDASEGFALMIIDLDHFKSVNDKYGHAAGDKVLCEVAKRLRLNLRSCDLVSRHGGEEFLVILPGADDVQATKTAERLRTAIADAPVAIASGESVPVTASIGLATRTVQMKLAMLRTGTTDVAEPRMMLAISRMFDAADAALYRAKAKGRNQVMLSASS